ncbi:MAG: D-alanyl-D-alanine carboxypeptidase [Acidimicrobiia bacterium]|nr:D-alanyl-D-alanine carboxypeptidase [Acidimicrobiia bacterium]
MTSVRRARPRRLLVAAALLTILAFAGSPAGAVPATQPPASYILVDADTGRVLMAKNEHAPHLTASTIKVLTALVALEHRPLDSTVQVSTLAASRPASKIDMKEGSAWTLDQAIHSLLIISANDAAYAIAESAGGDLPGFEKMANATAKRLGMRDTTFHDPAGLDGAEGFEGGTQSSAYDLAITARNALSVPAIADTAALTTYDFIDPTGARRHLLNHNRGFLNAYPGAIGLKTGYTSRAGRTLITAARRDGRTLIAVVMDTWDDSGWASYLLDQGFSGADGGADPARLPPVRTVPFDTRTAHFAAVPAAFGATLSPAAAASKAGPGNPPVAAAGTTNPTVTTTQPPTTNEAVSTPAAPGSAAPTAAATGQATIAAGTGTSDGWTWGSVARVVGIALFGLLVVLVILRRRAVKRQRARRLERLRAHREARRRGMIDVLEPDDADVRVVPGGTGHHVAASRRHPNDRRVQRVARPRRDTDSTRDRIR